MARSAWTGEVEASPAAARIQAVSPTRSSVLCENRIPRSVENASERNPEASRGTRQSQMGSGVAVSSLTFQVSSLVFKVSKGRLAGFALNPAIFKSFRSSRRIGAAIFLDWMFMILNESSSIRVNRSGRGGLNAAADFREL